MKNLIIFFLFFSFLSVFSINKGKKSKENPEETAYVEAVVTIGNNQCGYLLRLTNGQLIKPSNLPKKFQHYNEKVEVMLNDLKNVYNSPCGVQKEVHIVKIRNYKPAHNLQARY